MKAPLQAARVCTYYIYMYFKILFVTVSILVPYSTKLDKDVLHIAM